MPPQARMSFNILLEVLKAGKDGLVILLEALETGKDGFGTPFELCADNYDKHKLVLDLNDVPKPCTELVCLGIIRT